MSHDFPTEKLVGMMTLNSVNLTQCRITGVWVSLTNCLGWPAGMSWLCWLVWEDPAPKWVAPFPRVNPWYKDESELYYAGAHSSLCAFHRRCDQLLQIPAMTCSQWQTLTQACKPNYTLFSLEVAWQIFIAIAGNEMEAMLRVRYHPTLGSLRQEDSSLKLTWASLWYFV